MRQRPLSMSVVCLLLSSGSWVVAGGTGCSSGSAPGGGGGVGVGGSNSGGGGSQPGGSGGRGSGGGSGSGGGNSGTGGSNQGTGGGNPSGGAPGGNGGSTGAGGGGGAAPGNCATAAVSANAAGRLASEYQSWKTAHVSECTASNSAQVLMDAGTVVSEGIGYGMLLAAANDDQVLFYKLWKFYGDHLDARGLMNWRVAPCDPVANNNMNSATDGDLDAAMALVQANLRWGGYLTAAAGLIGKIKQYETDSCNGLNVLRPGDRFGGCSDTNPGNTGKVNPSYFAPGYYRVFATVDTANAAFWTKLAADSYTMLAQYQATMSGLVPEWGFVDGRTDGSAYGYNACRTPWRVAVDYFWYCTPEARTFLQGVSSYVDSNGGIAGVRFDKNSAFLGAFALSAMPLGQSKLDGYINAWLTTPMDDTPYYQATLRRLYLHLAAGQFARPAP